MNQVSKKLKEKLILYKNSSDFHAFLLISGHHGTSLYSALIHVVELQKHQHCHFCRTLETKLSSLQSWTTNTASSVNLCTRQCAWLVHHHTRGWLTSLSRAQAQSSG